MPGRREGSARMFREWGAPCPVTGRPRCGGHPGRDPHLPPGETGPWTRPSARSAAGRMVRAARASQPGGSRCRTAISCAPGPFSAQLHAWSGRCGPSADVHRVLTAPRKRRCPAPCFKEGDTEARGQVTGQGHSMKGRTRIHARLDWGARIAGVLPRSDLSRSYCHPRRLPSMPGASAAALAPAGRRTPHRCPLHCPKGCACVRVCSPVPHVSTLILTQLVTLDLAASARATPSSLTLTATVLQHLA